MVTYSWIRSGLGVTTLVEHICYGAMGNEGFRFFDPRIAEGITMTGQYFIQTVGAAVTEFITKMSGEDGDWAFYGDTDSVVGDTLIYVNGQKMKISDFYDSVTKYPSSTKSGVLVTRVEGYQSYGLTGNKELVERPIKYVMKHTVKKRMFTLNVDGKSVTITEDHSLIVLRDGQVQTIRPTELSKTDLFVVMGVDRDYEVCGFELVDEGVQECDVYDIEVDEVHNFFANDILVHNSAYFTLEPILKKYVIPHALNEDGSINVTKVIDAMDKIVNGKITPVINAACDDIAKYTNSKKQLMNFKREALATRGVWCCHPSTTVLIDGEELTLEAVWDSADAVDEHSRAVNLPSKNFNMITTHDDEVDMVYCRQYSGDMIKISVDGKELLLTPEHLVLVLSGGQYVWKPAGDLKVGDEVIALGEAQ